MKKSRFLPFIAAAAAGTAVGVISFTFAYSEGGSYLTNDPTACTNCHVMQEQFDGWLQSSHRSVATCNDCHAPHDVVGKYVTKARNGWAHSLAFTLGGFPDELQITASNLDVTEGACRYCHADLVEAVDGGDGSEPRPCTTCHSDVGHRGLAPLHVPFRIPEGPHAGVPTDD
jgi:cytochrome c nitrite reductase small subunit